jgi:hypothetical protein
LVQAGANLSGSVVIGGDAEPASACGAGTYMMFVPDRGCDGRTSVPAEADVNPAHGTFTDAEMAISGTTTPPDPGPTPTVGPTPTAGPTTGPPPPGTGCTATYRVTSQWQGGFQAEVAVRAGSVPLTGWTVTWTYANGQVVSQVWGAPTPVCSAR